MLRRLDTLKTEPLHRTATLRAIEQAAARALPAHTLMQRAGQAVARLVQARFPHAQRIVVLAGTGNNGGDGMVAAQRLHAAGRDVRVLACGADSLNTWVSRLPPDAAWAWEMARAAGVACASHTPDAALPDADLYLDALLGIGISGPVRAATAACIAALNAQTRTPVLSVDVPSGIDADHGSCGNVCVRATVTLHLLGLKSGLCTGASLALCGESWFDDLDLPASLHDVDTAPIALRQGADRLRALFPDLLHAAHKGERGDVLVIGGAAGMTGAALLAARTAARLGAGRVFVGLLDPRAPGVDPLAPELMLRAPDALLRTASKRGCVVFGPGAGSSASARDALEQALAQPLALVIDADGLNLLTHAEAQSQLLALLRARRSATVLTPHPLEAARLLGCDVQQVQGDRLRAAQMLAQRYGAWVVLKGAGSVIASPLQALWINPTGNGLLATAGSGDVLAGAIAAMIAASGNAEALRAAVWLHGHAAELAAMRHGPTNFTAQDLPWWIASAWAEIA